jgi:hypothetical protein
MINKLALNSLPIKFQSVVSPEPIEHVEKRSQKNVEDEFDLQTELCLALEDFIENVFTVHINANIYRRNPSMIFQRLIKRFVFNCCSVTAYRKKKL